MSNSTSVLPTVATPAPHNQRLAAAYYVAAVGVLAFYGIRVCPFIDSLDPVSVVTTFAVGFGAVLAIKVFLEARFLPDGEPFTLSVYQFFIDFFLFVIVGLAIAIYHRWQFQFPMESGYKVMVGCAMFGIFAGLDNGLQRERTTPPPDEALTVAPKRIFPITRRLTVIFLGITVLTGIVAALVIIKDIDYLIENIGIESHADLRRAVFVDVGFVVGVVLVLSLRLMTAYGRNLNYMLALQISGLSNVSQGELDTWVPIITRDEFSLIASQTNLMIERLRRINHEQHELMDVSQALVTELDLDHLLGRIADAVRDFVDADRVSLFLYDADTDELHGRVAQGIESGELRFAADLGLAGHAFQTGQPVCVSDAYADRRFNRMMDEETGYWTKSILCLPIADRSGHPIGVIQALNKSSGEFTDSDVRRLAAFGAQAAVALVNAQAFSDLDNALAYNASILRSLTNGVVTLDTQNRVVKANEAARELLKLDETAPGRCFGELLGADQAWWQSVVVEQNESYLVDIDIELADESRRWVNLIRVPLADMDDKAIGSMLVFEDVTEEKRVRTTLSRYLPGQVADRVLADADNRLGGVNQLATVLFSDIRNFTTISERLGARETVTMLNEYFSAMVDSIVDNEGILDKYIGDAIMAIFGVPFPGADDSENAVRAALAMTDQLTLFNADRARQGKDAIDVGIGLSTGDVVAGNVGSPRRMDFTVIGDTVNLAARLESATKVYGVRILVSEQTANAIDGSGIAVRQLDRIQVKGKDESVEIYQVVTAAEKDVLDDLDQYADALAEYRRGRWREAGLMFAENLRRNPNDGPSRTLFERCKAMLRKGRDEKGWDGVWRF